MEEKQMPRLSSYRWVILAIVCLMDVASNYIQFQVSVLATQIMPALHISTAQFSSLLMAPMLVAVVLSLPAGSLADKFGAKKVVTVGCIISVIGAYGRLIATNFAMMMVMLLLFGVYMSILSTNTIKIFGIWFKQDTNLAMGMFFASASIGIILSQLTGPLFSSVKAAYMFSSTLLLVLSICWVLFIKDAPKGEKVPPSEPVTKYINIAVKSKKTWLVAIAGGIGQAASMSFTGILPQALINGKAMTPAGANAIASAAEIGSLIGAMLGPAIIGKMKKAKPIMVVFVTISALAMFMVAYLSGSGLLVIDLVLGGLFGASAGPILQSMIISFPEIGPKYAGSAGGIVGMTSTLLSYILPVVISSIAGQNYALTFMIQAALSFTTAFFVLALPDANRAKRK